MFYAIVSKTEKDDETGDPLYWNNELGWVNFSAASVFELPPPINLPADSELKPYQPWSVWYCKDRDIHRAGPFDSKQAAMAWVDANRFRFFADQDCFEFDLDEDAVYLLDPAHRTVLLEDSDFPSEEWQRNLRAGDQVQWNDPDEGTCSRVLTIRSIRWEGDDVFVIEDVDGSVVQGFLHELT